MGEVLLLCSCQGGSKNMYAKSDVCRVQTISQKVFYPIVKRKMVDMENTWFNLYNLM